MKRLMTLLVVVAIGIMIFAAPMVADPGATTTPTSPTVTDTTLTNPAYPPPPDGYVGPWPPDTTMTTDGGDEDPWGIPK